MNKKITILALIAGSLCSNTDGVMKKYRAPENVLQEIAAQYPQYSMHQIDSIITRPISNNESYVDQILDTVSTYTQVVDRHFIKAQIKQESKHENIEYNPYAVSKSKARGLMQFLKSTWPSYGTKNFDDAFNPEKNIRAGLKFNLWIEEYLSHRDPEWNNMSDDAKRKKIAAAHNQGTGTLRNAGYKIENIKKIDALYEASNHACRVVDEHGKNFRIEQEILNAYAKLTNNSANAIQ